MAKPKLDLIMPHLADRARLDQLDQLLRLRMQPVHEGFAEEGAGLARRMDHRVGLEGGQPHRLLAEHVLAGLRRLDRPFGMARMRRRDIDRIDLRVLQQRLIPVEDARARKILRQPRLARIARAIAASSPVRECATPPANALAMLPGPMMPQRIFCESFHFS